MGPSQDGSNSNNFFGSGQLELKLLIGKLPKKIGDLDDSEMVFQSGQRDSKAISKPSVSRSI